MKPKILISGNGSDCRNYIGAVTAAGGQPVVEFRPSFSPDYDGLLLTGGGDIDPSLFSAANEGSTHIDLERDLAELALVKAFLSLKKPVLGICRGHQVINVSLGGTLRQHVGDDLCWFHRPYHGKDMVHPVYSAEDSWYRTTYGIVFSVNSAHHQAIDRLGSGLRPVLWSESGIIEAVEHDSLPLISVQFHPERMTGENARPDAVDSAAIFTRFLDMCRSK